MTLVTEFHFGAHLLDGEGTIAGRGLPGGGEETPGLGIRPGPPPRRSGQESWSQIVTAEPMLISTMTGQRLTLAATGSWTAEHAYELEPLLEAVTERRLTARRSMGVRVLREAAGTATTGSRSDPAVAGRASAGPDHPYPLQDAEGGHRKFGDQPGTSVGDAW